MLNFRALGTLEARFGEEPLDIGWQRQREVLGVLLLQANRAVTVNDLIEAVWHDRPPKSALSNIHKYVCGLRQCIADGTDGRAPRLVTRHRGYELRLAEPELDVLQFEQLATQGRQARALHHLRRAGQLLADALRLWRGEVLEDLELGGRVAARIAALTEVRACLFAELVDIRLRLGEHDTVLAELRSETVTNPFRERTWEQLIVALYAADRRAEALTAFTQLRRALAEGLGIEPGARLQRLHRAVLADDASEVKRHVA